MFAFGLYNGQTANSPELNNKLHAVTRFSYPMLLGNQILEMGIQAYKGQFVIPRSNLSAGVKYKPDLNYTDERLAASVTLYPKPFGIQAEYNVGRGPAFNKQTDSIEVQSLNGGYITISYLKKFSKQTFIPFIRYQQYNGGKKHERDARNYNVRELEFGAEWQINKNFELVVNYTLSNRRYEDYILQNNLQKGNLLRIQAQVNF